MRNAHSFTVGQLVDVRVYGALPGEPEPFVAGYTVRAVEFEDVTVERNGVGFSIGVHRVRASA